MPSASALEPVLDAVLTRVQQVLAGRLFDASLSSPPARKALTVYEGAAAQSPVVPYVIVGGSTREAAFNTLGPAAGTKWGGTVTVPIRIVTQYPTTERQTHRMWEVVKAGLEHERFVIAGFGRALAEGQFAQILTDTIQGVVTRELVGEVELTVHQAP